VDHDAPPALTDAPSVKQTVLAWHKVGHSQRAIARELNIDRRKVKRIIDQAA
jgi:DNA-binding transcriptional regulator LsrR (DeoR family)